MEVWVTSTAGAGGFKGLSDKLGLSRGLVVQELGWDEDADDDVRVMIEDAIDGEFVEEAMEAVDLLPSGGATKTEIWSMRWSTA